MSVGNCPDESAIQKHPAFSSSKAVTRFAGVVVPPLIPPKTQSRPRRTGFQTHFSDDKIMSLPATASNFKARSSIESAQVIIWLSILWAEFETET